MKPHEETWLCESDDGVHFVTTGPDGFRGTFDEPEHARLAAQAPAMARLLLSLGAMDVYDTDARGRPVHMDRYQCSWCEGEGDSVDTVPHLHDCTLIATLRAAGVLE